MSETHDDHTQWCFAAPTDFKTWDAPSLYDRYIEAMNSRDEKRKNYQRALDAALENLMSWERMARADGFSVRLVTDGHNGAPFPVFEWDKITFMQAYGVFVEDAK